jgi:hypothetical protein
MNALRRTALLAVLITGLASGAAAFGAADDPPAAPPKTPDPYLGAWMLAIDGEPVGPVTTVEGCSLRRELTPVAPSPELPADKAVGKISVERCSFEFGQGMSERFTGWLSTSHDQPGERLALIRSDLPKPYVLELNGAELTELSVPAVKRSSATAVLLRAEVRAKSLRRIDDAAPLPARRLTPFSPSLVSASLDGAPFEIDALGPWTVKWPVEEAGFFQRHRVPQIGHLRMRVPEFAAHRQIDPWFQASMVDGHTGAASTRELKLTFPGSKGSGFEFTLSESGLVGGDLAQRADGNRSYELYTERVSVAAL